MYKPMKLKSLENSVRAAHCFQMIDRLNPIYLFIHLYAMHISRILTITDNSQETQRLVDTTAARIRGED